MAAAFRESRVLRARLDGENLYSLDITCIGHDSSRNGYAASCDDKEEIMSREVKINVSKTTEIAHWDPLYIFCLSAAVIIRANSRQIRLFIVFCISFPKRWKSGEAKASIQVASGVSAYKVDARGFVALEAAHNESVINVINLSRR